MDIQRGGFRTVEYYLTYGAASMLRQTSLLIALVHLVDLIPQPKTPSRHGRPVVYSQRLFLKALVYCFRSS
jgi:hypothetical protein